MIYGLKLTIKGLNPRYFKKVRNFTLVVQFLRVILSHVRTILIVPLVLQLWRVCRFSNRLENHYRMSKNSWAHVPIV